MSPIVTLIVPVYNQVGLLERALRTLETTEDRRFVVHIVDDGSTDPVQTLCTALQQQKAITYPLMFTRFDHTGNSTVMVNEAAYVADTRYIAYMNSDLEFPDPKWLGATLDCFDRFSGVDPTGNQVQGMPVVYKRVAIVGIKQLFPAKNPLAPGCVAHNGNFYQADGSWKHLEEFVPAAQSRFNTSGLVEGVTGAGMFVQREFWKDVGGFPVFWPYGWDDVGMCLQAHQLQALVVCQREHPILHVRSASYGRPKHPLYERNSRWIYLRWGHTIDRLVRSRQPLPA